MNEPNVGDAVRAHGEHWVRTKFTWTNGVDYRHWGDLADAPDLSIMVALNDVTAWWRLWGFADDADLLAILDGK